MISKTGSPKHETGSLKHEEEWTPFQVLVLPFVRSPTGVEFCLLRRADHGYFQGVAGGGEPGETPLEAATRELAEETGSADVVDLLPLQSMCMVPTFHFSHANWPELGLVIPEYAFGAELRNKKVLLSLEHTEKLWLTYDEARELFKWDSNKTALWELHGKLGDGQK